MHCNCAVGDCTLRMYTLWDDWGVCWGVCIAGFILWELVASVCTMGCVLWTVCLKCMHCGWVLCIVCCRFMRCGVYIVGSCCRYMHCGVYIVGCVLWMYALCGCCGLCVEVCTKAAVPLICSQVPAKSAASPSRWHPSLS